MKLKIIAATIIVVIIIFVLSVFFWKYLTIDLYDTGVNDEEYIKIARQSIEVQKFLEKYPDATANVDRSGQLAVDFIVNKYEQTSDKIPSYIRLRIFINPWNNQRMGNGFIDCSGRRVWSNVIEYISKDKCLQ